MVELQIVDLVAVRAPAAHLLDERPAVAVVLL
jgi:hypothetical protein